MASKTVKANVETPGVTGLYAHSYPSPRENERGLAVTVSLSVGAYGYQWSRNIDERIQLALDCEWWTVVRAFRAIAALVVTEITDCGASLPEWWEERVNLISADLESSVRDQKAKTAAA